MKKSILFTLPVVAILAGCSGKIEVYRDIFKDARQLSSEVKEAAVESLDYYHFSGTRLVAVVEDGEELSHSSETLEATYSHSTENGNFANYIVDEVSKFDIRTNESGAFVWHTAPSDSSLIAEAVYNKFRDVVFSWNGHILSGDFNTLPYEYDTKLLNVVSPKCRVNSNKKTSEPNFTVDLNNSVSYKDGNITHVVSLYHAQYKNYRLDTYSCNYEYKIDSINLKVTFSISGSFEYELIH